MVGHDAMFKGALSKEDHERLLALLKTSPPRYRQELADAVRRVRSLLAELNGLAVLARFVATHIMIFWGEYFEPTAEGSEAKVEFLAGLLATTETRGGHDPPPPDLVQSVIDGVDEVFDVAHLLNLSEGLAMEAPEELSEVRYTSRGQWLNVRGPAYEHHARDLAHAIYDDLAGSMRQRLGFHLDDVIAVEAALEGLVEERYNALVQTAGEVAPRIAADPALRAVAQKQDPPPTDLELQQWAFMQVWEQGLTAALTFDRGELLERVSGLTEGSLTSLLQRLSVELGTLPAREYTSPFEMNPLEDRPFVHVGDRYMLPVPGMIAREYPTIVERDMLKAYKQFAKRRARVLDRLAVGYLSDMLRGSVAQVGLSYPIVENGEEKWAECDGLIIFDRVAIVVEGKGSPLSSAARRGDVMRVRRDLERSVEEAASQGARARRYLLSGHRAVFYDERRNEILTVDSSSLDKIYVLNPTLHEMGGHALHPGRLRALGLPGTEDFWSVYINDLRIIAEVVDNPAEFLHYLAWRSRLPLGDRVEAIDEIDLFGSYLLRQQFRQLEDPSSHISVTGSSTDFDTYYMGETRKGPPAGKPRMFTIPSVRTFVRRMSRDRPAGWLAAAGVCLDLSLEELAFVDVEIRRARARDEGWVWWGTFDRCTLIMMGPSVRWRVVWEQFRMSETPAKRVIFADTKGGRGRLVWALDSEGSGGG